MHKTENKINARYSQTHIIYLRTLWRYTNAVIIIIIIIIIIINSKISSQISPPLHSTTTIT